MPFFSRILFAVIVFLGSFGVPQAAAAQGLPDSWYYWAENAALRASDLPAGYTQASSGWEANGHIVLFATSMSILDRGPVSIISDIVLMQDPFEPTTFLENLTPDIPAGFSETGVPRAFFGRARTFVKYESGTFGPETRALVVFVVDGAWGMVQTSGRSHVTNVPQALALADRIMARLEGDTRNRGRAFELSPL